LERETAIRIIKKVEQIKNNPYQFLKKLKGDKASRLRVGDYLVILDLDHEKNILNVLKVGHRKNIYKT